MRLISPRWAVGELSLEAGCQPCPPDKKCQYLCEMSCFHWFLCYIILKAIFFKSSCRKPSLKAWNTTVKSTSGSPAGEQGHHKAITVWRTMSSDKYWITQNFHVFHCLFYVVLYGLFSLRFHSGLRVKRISMFRKQGNWNDWSLWLC